MQSEIGFGVWYFDCFNVFFCRCIFFSLFLSLVVLSTFSCVIIGKWKCVKTEPKKNEANVMMQTWGEKHMSDIKHNHFYVMCFVFGFASDARSRVCVLHLFSHNLEDKITRITCWFAIIYGLCSLLLAIFLTLDFSCSSVFFSFLFNRVCVIHWWTRWL